MSETDTLESIQRTNRALLIDYFASGIAPRDKCPALGVEVEHFIVHDGTLKPVHYHADGDAFGVADILTYLKEFYPEEIRNSHGDLLGLANETGTITLEPAAQLEISIAPYNRVSQVKAAYQEFRNHLDPYLADKNCHAATYGYHPSAQALKLPLIPKERYEFMNAHFQMLGTHGERMMRASASTQVSIDYYSEEDAVRKLRIATALGPIMAFICDNVPVFEGAPSNAALEHLNLWRDVDSVRCETIPGLFDEGFGFAAYADWLLRTPPIFITRPAANNPDGPSLRIFKETPASEAYGDAPMQKHDLEHLISMFWPDVRLKRFVEIRQADSMPADQVYGYAALIKGLYYSQDNLAALEEALGVVNGSWPLDDSSVNSTIAPIRKDGANAIVYGKPLAEWVELVFALAANALDDEEAAFLAPLHDWIGR